jgi:hypothetical protein
MPFGAAAGISLVIAFVSFMLEVTAPNSSFGVIMANVSVVSFTIGCLCGFMSFMAWVIRQSKKETEPDYKENTQTRSKPKVLNQRVTKVAGDPVYQLPIYDPQTLYTLKNERIKLQIEETRHYRMLQMRKARLQHQQLAMLEREQQQQYIQRRINRDVRQEPPKLPPIQVQVKALNAPQYNIDDEDREFIENVVNEGWKLGVSEGVLYIKNEFSGEIQKASEWGMDNRTQAEYWKQYQGGKLIIINPAGMVIGQITEGQIKPAN